MRYARTLDSATVTVHNVLLNPEIFTLLTDIGIKNNCYMLSKDAAEDVVALTGEMDDLLIKIYKARYMRAVDKGPTYVRTYDFKPNDIIVAHYHCGIAPEPSSIDVETMNTALRAQLFATVPGKPRVFGIISPVVMGRSFCLDIGIYEPVPSITIGYDVKKLKVKNLDIIEEKKKGLALAEVEDGTYYLIDVCSEPEEGCVPYRYGTSPDIVLEDLIFIASYYNNFNMQEFPYLKVAPTKTVAYEVKVADFDRDKVVVRGLAWSVLKASRRELAST